MIPFIIGIFIGANLSLFLYALIIVAKKADENFITKEENSE